MDTSTGENSPNTPDSLQSDTPSLTLNPNPWPQIASEHCYPKIMAQWSTLEGSLPTHHIFQRCRPSVEDSMMDSGVESTGEDSERNESREDLHLQGDDCEEDVTVDVEHVTPPPSLPYNERKVTNVMYECTHHMNLVRLPLENHEGLLEKIILESLYQQQLLIKRVLDVLRAEHLARLAFVGIPEQPIQRRLNCDKSARKVRKVLNDVKWDPKLCHWLHRTFLRALDNTYLPIYLDILQVLKSKCPTLVEGMIHGGNVGEGANEAVNLLLKRPWSVIFGMQPMDKRVNFDSAPVFLSIPHSSSILGGRRWRLWQTQLGSIGKVFPVIPPNHLLEAGQDTTQQDAAETLFHCALNRLQEIKEQYPSRPIILISWCAGCRIACKLAEVENVACLINLGLSSRGLDYCWKVSADPFYNCVTPSVFVIGDQGLNSSCEYVQELCSKMKAKTSVIFVHGADDLLRLPFSLKKELNVTQSMIDRLIQDRIYEFFVYILPCSFPSDTRQFRKRKTASEEITNSQLSSATPNGTIVLTSHAQTTPDDSLSPVLRGLLSNNGKMSIAGSIGRSNSASLRAFTQASNLSSAEFPSSKLPKIGRPPKNPRPRSKSTTTSLDQKLKAGKNAVRNRSLSDQQQPVVSAVSSPDNTNCNNSNEASPNTLLAITHFQSQIPALLPVTPPKNPYENPNQISDPKIRKQLNL